MLETTSRDFMFEVNQVRCFRTLKEKQFKSLSRKEALLLGLIREPIANAFDQQGPDHPIIAEHELSGDTCIWRIGDVGSGLTHENVKGLHYIGSTGSPESEERIGGDRFRLPVVAHRRWGIELDDVPLDQRSFQPDRGIQGRAPLHRVGPAQRQRRPVLRSARDRATVGFIHR